MYGAVRRGDFVTSTCQNVPSGPFTTSSTSSFIEGRGQVRLGDRSIPGVVITGSQSVFIDGRPATRKIDRVICGIITTCSTTTFIE